MRHIGLIIFVSVCVFIAGFATGELNIRNKAIAAKVARWVANPETGDTKFEFISPK